MGTRKPTRSEQKLSAYEEVTLLAKQCRSTFARTIEPIRTAARAKGYAVAVHGSLARDIDLVAVPWSDRAVGPQALLRTVMRAIRVATDEKIYLASERPTRKPHGRLAWSIHCFGGPYFDLSITPRRNA